MKTRTSNKTTEIISFYLLCSIISFGGTALFLFDKGIPGNTTQIDIYFPQMLMILLSGPILSGIILKVLYDGKLGLLDIFKDLIKVKYSFKWYFFALLLTPLVVLTLLVLLSIFSGQYKLEILNAENKTEILIQGIMVGIFGGLVEELGWTGFLTPKLVNKNNILNTGIIVGLFWGIWHIPMTYWASGDVNGNLSMDLFMPPFIFYLTVLPVFRIFMVWLYSRTSSMLLSILTHASLIFSTLFVLKPVATGFLLIVYYILLSLVLWAFVFIIQKQTNGNQSMV